MASNAKKGSRITIACNSCRSRKQKCGGGKPVCTQCLEHNRPCDWPEQLKRGPAKGYIEVLENRLHETETVLLKVLSQIPDAQLASTLARDQSNRDGGYSPFPRLGKRGAEYWRRFPLDTASNVRDWQQDCSSQKRPDPIDWETDRVQPESCMSSPQHAPKQDSEQAPTGYDGRRESSLEIESRNPALEVSPGAMHPTHATSPPLHLQQDASISQQQLRGRKRSANEAASLSHHSPNQRPTDHQNTSQEPSSWTGAPPVQFQEQFLW